MIFQPVGETLASLRPNLARIRFSCGSWCVRLLVVFISAPLPAAESPGLVAEQPAEGRFVKTDQGFMVPYTATIPGTDIEFEMVPVPGGTFTLGSPDEEEGRKDDEGPQVQVTVDPLWIGKHEITWREYSQFMQTYDQFKDFESRRVRIVNEENEGDTITAPTPLYDPSFTYMLGEEPNQPAVTMSHYAARQYTKWLSLLSEQTYRLPTEAEWEYACRAGTETAYSFGEDGSEIDEYAWYYDNSDDTYHDVGTKEPNDWGIHDMHGNVAELVLDQYKDNTYQQWSKAPVSSSTAVVWTETIFPHVVRGGSWFDEPELLRSASRGVTDNWREEDPNLPKSPWWFTDEPALSVGFRLARPLIKPSDEFLKKAWEIDNPSIKMAVEGRLSEGRGVRGLVDPKLAEGE